MNGNVVLVSPFYPEAGFNRFNAMDRNKYIYCLADTSVVVHSGPKGGTWEGAIQNIKKDWVPTWVKQTQDQQAGNAAIVNAGAKWCTDSITELDITSLFVSNQSDSADISAQNDLFGQSQTDLFSHPLEQPEADVEVNSSNTNSERKAVDDVEAPSVMQSEPNTGETNKSELKSVDSSEHAVKENEEKASSSSKPQSEQVGKDSFFNLFLLHLQEVATKSVTEAELVETTGLHKSQVKAWLKDALEQEQITKLTRPVRYQCANNQGNN
jgi:predicted Rossmann fold nucleotide-binding protein DprA/Smf involved in DNA uptake